MSMRVFDVILKALAIKLRELKNQGLSYLVLQFHMFSLMGSDPSILCVTLSAALLGLLLEPVKDTRYCNQDHKNFCKDVRPSFNI